MIQKMYPAVCVAIPIYLVMRGVGLIDTIPGLVIVNTSFNLPMTIWLMIGFFQDVPDGIEQSGKIDEYLISRTQRIDDDDPMSFHGRMKREFYDRVDPKLVMPESQRHFPEPGREAQYDRMLEDLGGADMCFGGLGINGHVAFNEAVDAGDPIAADEFANLGTRILPITRETRAINAFGYQRGDLMGMPELCITIGMKQILASRKIYIALNRPWQHGPLKHVLLDPEQPQWPATLLRRVKELQYCMTSDIAKGIVTD